VQQHLFYTALKSLKTINNFALNINAQQLKKQHYQSSIKADERNASHFFHDFLALFSQEKRTLKT